MRPDCPGCEAVTVMVRIAMAIPIYGATVEQVIEERVCKTNCPERAKRIRLWKSDTLESERLCVFT